MLSRHRRTSHVRHAGFVLHTEVNISSFFVSWILLLLLSSNNCWSARGLATTPNNNSSSKKNSNSLTAAVIVPGFLTGAGEFQGLCETLTRKGLPTIAVPMPNWHWLPCLGGRSARPILERIDFCVQHLIANDGDVTKPIPEYGYSLQDLWVDFQNNPGGVFEVGGSSKVDEYPLYNPRGTFPLPNSIGDKQIALIGHSAGGWISRVYLSSHAYGGKTYGGSKHVHSLVTLGTPHVDALGPPFAGVQWINHQPPDDAASKVPTLNVAGSGFQGGEWGDLTQASYAFCCPNGTDGTSYDGDGVTPTFSGLGMEGADHMQLEGVHHFCWDVFGSSIVAPELSKDYKKGRPWYGTDGTVDKWADWILDQV